MNVKDLKDEYLGRCITVNDPYYAYTGILVKRDYEGKQHTYGFVSVSDYWVRCFFDFDVIEFVE